MLSQTGIIAGLLNTFYCSAFIQGRKLYVDDFTHEGEVYEGYGMGTSHGLTLVKLEKS